MSLLNWGAGLSQAGAGIAQFAGSAAVLQQKADLDSQQAVLTNQLTATRETAGRAQAGEIAAAAAGKQQEFEKGMETQREGAAIALAKTTSGLSVEAQAQIQQNAADLTKKLGSDPAYIAAQKALDSADPVKMAQASEMQNQAALYALQTDSAKKVADARQAIIDEQSKPNGGDPDKLAQLNTNFSTLLTDPAAAAALRTAAVGNERVAEDAASRASTDLNAATAKLQDPNISGDPAARASLQANVDQLTQRVRALNKAADDARAMANGQFGMKTAPAQPELPKFNEGDTLHQNGRLFKVIGGKPVDQGPDPDTAARGLINK